MKKLSPFIRYDIPAMGKMLTPAAFLLFIGWHFEEFIVHAVMANKAINLGILGTAVYGIVIIMIRLRSMQKDMSALDRFSREAQASGDMKTLLDANWLKSRPIRHYLEHLAHTEGKLASQLDQDAIQNELGALSEEYNSKMELPQFLVGFMIAMGLLGTFIGLLETLTGISGMLDGMGHGGNIEQEFSKLIVELRKPLSGMGIAFSASMFGLVGSLLLSIMMIMLRRFMSRVMEKARNVMHKLITRIKFRHIEDNGEGELVEGGSSGSHVDMSFIGSHDMGSGSGAGNGSGSQFSDMITDAYFRSQDAIATMANSVTMLTKRLDNVSRSIEASTEATHKTNTMLSFGPRMIEAQDQLIEEVKTLGSSQGDGHKLVQKIISSMIQIDQSLYAINTKDVALAQREMGGTLSEMFNNSQTHTRLMSEMIEAEREGSKEIANALKSLQDRMKRQDEINALISENIGDIREKLTHILTSFSSVETVAESISKQSLLAEAALSEERQTQKALIGSIQKELRAFTDDLRKILAPTSAGGDGPKPAS